MIARGLLSDHQIDGFAVNDFVGRIGKLDQDLVWAGRQLVGDKRLTARIHPSPRPIVHRDVEMTNPW